MKKFLVAGLCLALTMSTTVVSMASTADAVSSNYDTGISIQSSKEKITKEYQRTDSGTLYSDDKTKKVVWNDDIYNVYYENVGTGAKRLAYKEHRWSWTGYEKSGGKWVKKTTKKGTSREHLDPMSFLNSFLYD